MIVYDKFWETMKRCGESTYTLINHYNISSGTIDRIRKGQGITPRPSWTTSARFSTAGLRT